MYTIYNIACPEFHKEPSVGTLRVHANEIKLLKVLIHRTLLGVSTLTDVNYPWTSFSDLRHDIIAGDTKKSWARRKNILEKLITSDGLCTLELSSVLLFCVNKICLTRSEIPYVPIYRATEGSEVSCSEGARF